MNNIISPEPFVEVISQIESDDFPDTWYELSNENHFWFIWRINSFISQIKHLGIPQTRELHVLEVGCGNGTVRKQLEKHTNWNIDGVEINLKALNKNGSNRRGRTMLYNVHDRDESLKEKYDAIILFDVIEHIEDIKLFLQSCIFHLKQNGLMFINVPALNLLFSQYDKQVGHYRRYNKLMIHNQLVLSNLQVIDMRYWGVISLPMLIARKLLLKLLKLDRRNVVNIGFKPPSPLFNSFITKIAIIDTKIFISPRIGASLLAIAKK
jgi:2-polyprenyl-3-methyl-5-hydroxy-6-metoxy-1,4-benzoquinol methylase